MNYKGFIPKGIYKVFFRVGDDRGYIKSAVGNSIGGSALEVGSVKVNTINLARLSYENKTSYEYLEALKEKTLLCIKTLDVIRSIVKRNIEKGLLPNYKYNLINLDSQYNTIGIIGLYEALQTYGYVYDELSSQVRHFV